MLKDELGNHYGALAVIKRHGTAGNGSATWLCECECGNEIVVRGYSLREGNTTSCGCLRAIQEVGNRYGKLVVVKRHGSNKKRLATWLCKCDCGNTCIVAGSHLRSGHTRSCGCLNPITRKSTPRKSTPRKNGLRKKQKDPRVICPSCGEELPVLKRSADGKRGSAWCSKCERVVRAMCLDDEWRGK